MPLQLMIHIMFMHNGCSCNHYHCNYYWCNFMVVMIVIVHSVIMVVMHTRTNDADLLEGGAQLLC